VNVQTLANTTKVTMKSIQLGSLEKRCQQLEATLQENTAILRQVKHERHDLEVRIKAYEEERVKFEEERQEWGSEMERNHQEILEQNDRLTVLSQTLAGTKVLQGKFIFMLPTTSV